MLSADALSHFLRLLRGGDAAGDQEAETTPGGSGEEKWAVVAETSGLINAQVIAGSLQAEGIPARAWQEGAGQALGLTVGLLGTGYVMVPQSFLEQARDFLQTRHDLEEDTWPEEGAGDEEEAA